MLEWIKWKIRKYKIKKQLRKWAKSLREEKKMKYKGFAPWLVIVMIASQLQANPLSEYDIQEYGICLVSDVELPCIKLLKNGETYLAVFSEDGETLCGFLTKKLEKSYMIGK